MFPSQLLKRKNLVVCLSNPDEQKQQGLRSQRVVVSCLQCFSQWTILLTIYWPDVWRQRSCSVHSAKIYALQQWTTIVVVASLFRTHRWKIKVRSCTWILKTVNANVTIWWARIGAGRLIITWWAPRRFHGTQEIETRWVVVTSWNDISAGWIWKCSLGTLILISARFSTHRRQKYFCFRFFVFRTSAPFSHNK